MSADARRLAVRLTPDALRQVRGGHPWVYAESITSITDGGAPGDLAVVFDDRRRFAAIGLYDPASPIRLKVLHHGRPTTIDAAWWQARITESAAKRERIGADTTGWRVVHGENDGLPGLVVDHYADTVVVKLYSAALVAHLDAIRDAVVAVLAPRRVVLRASRLVAPALADRGVDRQGHGVAIAGDLPTGPVRFVERGLSLAADVVDGQKTGHFLDQRDNRALAGHHAAGLSVLDVFACTGGFAVHAAAGGAHSVHLVDQSSGAIAAAHVNRELNLERPDVAACGFTSDVGDAFEVLDTLARRKRRFGMVIVDPPSFASKRDSVPAAMRAYRRLTRLALPLVEPGGLLLQASCSSRVSADELYAAIVDEARQTGRPLDVVERTGHPIDHPIGFPQGGYLKAMLARA